MSALSRQLSPDSLPTRLIISKFSHPMPAVCLLALFFPSPPKAPDHQPCPETALLFARCRPAKLLKRAQNFGAMDTPPRAFQRRPTSEFQPCPSLRSSATTFTAPGRFQRMT